MGFEDILDRIPPLFRAEVAAHLAALPEAEYETARGHIVEALDLYEAGDLAGVLQMARRLGLGEEVQSHLDALAALAGASPW